MYILFSQVQIYGLIHQIYSVMVVQLPVAPFTNMDYI